jgi:hypothetical protein
MAHTKSSIFFTAAQFLPDMTQNLPSDPLQWHTVLAVCKLQHLECTFPLLLGGKLLNNDRIIREAEYLRDVYQVKCVDGKKPSALMRVLDGEESASRMVTLRVLFVDLSLKSLVLTDGVVVISARCDAYLAFLTEKERIAVGSLLRIVNATLEDMDTPAPYLSLKANGVKLVKASRQSSSPSSTSKAAKAGRQLGHSRWMSFKTHMTRSVPMLGTLPCIDILVLRVYPSVATGGEKTTSVPSQSATQEHKDKDGASSQQLEKEKDKDKDKDKDREPSESLRLRVLVDGPKEPDMVDLTIYTSSPMPSATASAGAYEDGLTEGGTYRIFDVRFSSVGRLVLARPAFLPLRNISLASHFVPRKLFPDHHANECDLVAKVYHIGSEAVIGFPNLESDKLYPLRCSDPSKFAVGTLVAIMNVDIVPLDSTVRLSMSSRSLLMPLSLVPRNNLQFAHVRKAGELLRQAIGSQADKALAIHADLMLGCGLELEFALDSGDENAEPNVASAESAANIEVAVAKEEFQIDDASQLDFEL